MYTKKIIIIFTNPFWSRGRKLKMRKRIDILIDSKAFRKFQSRFDTEIFFLFHAIFSNEKKMFPVCLKTHGQYFQYSSLTLSPL